MMAAGISLAGLSVIVGYKSLHTPAPVASAQTAPAYPANALALAGANRAIAVGETISPGLVRTVVGDVNRNPGAATPAEAIGKVATRPIPAGSLIQRTMIDDRARLAIRVPLGMRAMSIDTTAEIAVAGLIRPGDNVDIQAVYPGEDTVVGARGTGRSEAKTVLQMVPVLAVGQLVLGSNPAKTNPNAPGSENALPAAARTVTLALTPAQVQTVSLAKTVGTIMLSLRNPDDRDMGAAITQVSDKPIAHAAPSAAPAAPRRPRAAARPQVQIVIGGHSNLSR